MNIVVCVKMVPDTTQVKIDPVTNTLVREGVPFITNPFDTHAVEEALRLKDKYGACVIAISMGPPTAESVLQRAIALGVDDAVLLSDKAFGGADTLATSKVLAAAIAKLGEKEPVDLVICGKQTIDGDTAQVGPGIARRLKFSQLTLVDKILEIDQQKKIIRVRRKLEEQYETVESTLPALITVVREINVPRYPTVPGRLDAAERRMPVWTNDVLKLDPKMIGLTGSPTQVRRIFAPQREKGEIIPGEGNYKQQAVETLIEKLIHWNFVSLEQRDPTI
ncbi:MAG TPA: electron transfer flavoprotein subunit beta/FixA family protein [Thermodesulfobacteriota bacterium]|nr:electron transfer flavoprotein subunit beta/FixA family protein [Thermodesulfobacteriota bacterium]